MRPAANPSDLAATRVARAVSLGRRVRDVRAVWGSGRLDPRLREEVMLAVAQANSCRWCTYAHRRWALSAGVSDAELAALEGLDPDGFSRRTWAAIAWAQARAVDGHGRVPPELAAELERHYDARERADLALVVGVMNVVNRVVVALEGAVARAHAATAALRLRRRS